MSELKSFLEEFGLGEYSEKFDFYGYELATLKLADESELDAAFGTEQVDMRPGHKIKLLKALQGKKANVPVVIDLEEDAPPLEPSPVYTKGIQHLYTPMCFVYPSEKLEEISHKNQTLKSIFESAHNAIPIFQLRDYISIQQKHQWSLHIQFEAVKDRYHQLFSSENKDGHALNAQKVLKQDFQCENALDLVSVRSCLELLGKHKTALRQFNDLVKDHRARLYDRELTFKQHWKESELNFYLNLCREVSAVKEEVERNEGTLREKEDAAKTRYSVSKVSQEKESNKKKRKLENKCKSQARKKARASEAVVKTLEIICPDADFDGKELSNVELDCVTDSHLLLPRFHLGAVDELIKHAKCSNRAISRLKEISLRLKKEQEKVTQKNIRSKINKSEKAKVQPISSFFQRS